MKHWIKIDPCQGITADSPPTMEPSWFASAGNSRDSRPHVRLAAPVLENTSDCTHWMPYTPDDAKPRLPGAKGKGKTKTVMTNALILIAMIGPVVGLTLWSARSASKDRH